MSQLQIATGMQVHIFTKVRALKFTNTMVHFSGERQGESVKWHHVPIHNIRWMEESK